MKNSFKYILSAFVLAGSLVACSPEEYAGVSESGVPQATAFGDKVKIQVDQELNQVSLTLDAPGVYPIWTITMPDGKKQEKTSTNGYTKIYTNSGDYTVTLKVGNRNGISDGEYTTSFHLNNTIVDFTKYTTMLSKANWHMANKEKGHLACGESGSDGTNWWSGDPDCKLNEGVYDNELTFTADFKYTFNPGDHGTIYVNKGVTIWPDYRNPDEDFNVPVELQNSEYGLEVDGDDLYLTFKKGTYFPYIANDYIWNTPRYKVVNLTTKKMTLLIDEPGVIAWQYILTTENTVEKAFTGFTYDQPNNIWKNVEVKAGDIYYADGGWAPYPDNGGATFEVTNQETHVVLPLATASQWQAQFPIHTNVGPGSQFMTSAKHYDFSCVITSNKDLKNMTLKLVETGDNGVPGSLGIAYDANAVFYDNSTNLTAYEDYVFYLVDQPGVDIQDNVLQLVLDFGGCAEGTEVTVKNIVLIEHDLNTELDKLPGDAPDAPTGPQVDWSGANLLAGMTVDISQWYAPGWNQIADAEYTADGGVFTITYPEAASDQWMAQFTFNNTGIALDPAKSYDFRIKMISSTDHPGVTIKLTQQDDDDTFITADRHPLTAFEETWIELADLKFIVNDKGKGVIDNLKMPFDFGGVAAGTVITFSDMHLQEHKEKAGAGSASWDGENLIANIAPELSQWYAPGWNQIADAEYTADKGVYNIIYPSATTDQWMAQFTLNKTGVALDPAKTYDLRLKMISSTDHPGATVKFTQQDDDNTFITADRHPLAAYEETWIELTDLKFIVNGEGKGVIDNLKIVFDFGGNAENTEITISDMHLQEHKAGGNSGSGAAPFDYDSSDNLWKTATLSNAGIYYAPNWAQITDFGYEITNKSVTVSLPEATFGEWQAQLPILTNLDNTIISADKKYDFQCKIMASKDHPGMTLKLVEEGPNSTPGSLGINYDSNAIFYSPGVALQAYDEVEVTLTGLQGVALQDNPLKLVLDFGNNAAETDIEIYDIILREAK